MPLTMPMFTQAEKMDSVLEAIQRPAEGTMNWARYQDIFLTEKRTNAGKNFLENQAEVLQAAGTGDECGSN